MGNKYEVYAWIWDEKRHKGFYERVYAGESFITDIFASVYSKIKGVQLVKIEWR